MQPGNTGKNFRENNREESLNPELSQEIDGFLKTSEKSEENSHDEPLLYKRDVEDELTEDEVDENDLSQGGRPRSQNDDARQ